MKDSFNNLHLPTICVDGFFDNPDAVREFALTCKFTKNDDGAWPGKRTEQLHTLNQNLFKTFCNKLFSIFFNLKKEGASWKVSATFQLVDSFNSNPEHTKNIGWIHRDENYLYSGVVYLTPGINANTGTSIFRRVKEQNYNHEVKTSFYKDGIDINSTYDEMLLENNSAFEETARFNNVYNRLIGMEGHVYHGVNSYFTVDSPRLTLVYFIEGIRCENTPLKRIY